MELTQKELKQQLLEANAQVVRFREITKRYLALLESSYAQLTFTPLNKNESTISRQSSKNEVANTIKYFKYVLKESHTQSLALHNADVTEGVAEQELLAVTDLVISSYRDKNAGSWSTQEPNGIRITHIPSGIYAESIEERSAHKNRATAMDKLNHELKKGWTTKSTQSQALHDADVIEQHMLDKIEPDNQHDARYCLGWNDYSRELRNTIKKLRNSVKDGE